MNFPMNAVSYAQIALKKLIDFSVDQPVRMHSYNTLITVHAYWLV